MQSLAQLIERVQRYHSAADVELIRRASTHLPPDVVEALEKGKEKEAKGSLAESALVTILDNVELAKERVAPICQDTGTPVAWVSYPQGASTRVLQAALEEAVRKATELNYLRPNAVDSVTGKNTGDGSGRVFIAQQTGQIMIWDGDALLGTPFLDLSGLVSCCGEQGLLGLAFHPDYPSNGHFFVYYTDGGGDTVVARYTVSGGDFIRKDFFGKYKKLPDMVENYSDEQLAKLLN